jgi:hypothetical protein
VIGLSNFRLRAGNNDGGVRRRKFGIDLGGGVWRRAFIFNSTFQSHSYIPILFGTVSLSSREPLLS